MKFAILAICVALTAAKPHIYLYDGPSAAPIGRDGSVIDTPEVALVKKAHLEGLASASVKASSGEAVETAHPIPASNYEVFEPAVGYQGPPAPLGEDGRVIDTVEVAQLKAERLSALEKATAEAAAAEASAAAVVHVNGRAVHGMPIILSELQEVPTFIMAEPFVAPVQEYKDSVTMIGQDSRVDTGEVAKLKAEHLAALEKANAAAIALAGASGSSVSTISSEGYAYVAPVVHETRKSPIETPVVNSQLAHNGFSALLGQERRLSIVVKIAKLTAKYLAALKKAYASAVALTAITRPILSVISSGGYAYAPLVQSTETFAPPTPTIETQGYNGPLAPLAEDGLVVDTEEVAKLKAEHLAALEKANAAAIALAGASGSSTSTISSEEYSYVSPVVHETHTSPIETPILKPQQAHNVPLDLLGQERQISIIERVAKLTAMYLAALKKAYASAVALAAISRPVLSVISSGGYAYAPSVQSTETFAFRTPTVEPQGYSGHSAPLAEDGRVIDTEEVTKLKAENLAAWEKANAFATASGSSMSTSSAVGNTCFTPVVQHPETPDVKPDHLYNTPPAPIGDDKHTIDNLEFAELKAEHLATQNKAEAFAAASSSSSSSATYDASAITQTFANSEAHGVIQPQQTYTGPVAPFSKDGQVVEGAVGVTKKPAAVVNSPPFSGTQELPGSTAQGNGVKPAPTPKKNSYALVRRVVLRRPYNGPLAPLGENGQVVDTEEVAKLKAERLSNLNNAYSHAIKLANAKKTARSSDEVIESAAQNSDETFQGY